MSSSSEGRRERSTWITAISADQVAAYRPYTFFASTGYCPPTYTLAWSCGVNCLANPDFKPLAAGGDGEFIQYWFVGYSPSLKRVIVSHEGTRLGAMYDIHDSRSVSMLTDVSIAQMALNSALFPDISPGIRVHSGFADEQLKTASSILAAVQTALEKYNASGAIALLDSVYLPLHLPAFVKVNTVAYGLPRVGNQAFADYVDAHLSLIHINNQKDIVPIIPSSIPFFVNYRQPAGEIHIQASGEWDSCPGQENESDLCSAGDVPNIFSGSIANHDGPYAGVETSCKYLTGGLK
ncbi:lipase [Mycena belliarum]|uniref:Lipase n=1 Tax=Mycena belliarum TaxID=1033014 RepID=A0AAD6U415_9AGAR|nr:lipase [Mycena belliae]